GRAVQKGEQQPLGLAEQDWVYGNSQQQVTVLVKVFTDSPWLLCMDLAGSQAEVIDPKYVWIGPDGKNLEGQRHANLTAMGKLMLTDFQESMSGAYTCTFSHKILEPAAQEEREVVESYQFMLYASREAEHAYQLSARFSTKGCKLQANSHFFQELQKVLNNILSDLLCHITGAAYTCHAVQTPRHSLLHQLFVSFQVSPCAAGWEEVCQQIPSACEDVTKLRAQQARDRVEQFFRQQTSALQHKFQLLPSIHYVASSFSSTRVTSCQPGFGKSQLCSSCCVICQPGTYSPGHEVSCQICARPRVQEYGARSC
ncbi:ZPBP2 protein, partial [Bucco capensis]|nr:ZPBP2 protein [Bucco capensis]